MTDQLGAFCFTSTRYRDLEPPPRLRSSRAAVALSAPARCLARQKRVANHGQRLRPSLVAALENEGVDRIFFALPGEENLGRGWNRWRHSRNRIGAGRGMRQAGGAFMGGDAGTADRPSRRFACRRSGPGRAEFHHRGPPMPISARPWPMLIDHRPEGDQGAHGQARFPDCRHIVGRDGGR